MSAARKEAEGVNVTPRHEARSHGRRNKLQHLNKMRAHEV
eukprot:CAMPEP_0185775696 /NCGR_PEP_ID=MMETSP1174-20130828/82998_1 /TAXON_ID=35687 /ORGANISM="Dictyocha speculum, Strain CCMP1381" /LENGTH=39 /DNA_ID= /DNA_START= /DNA_END= /DNA_ORIENTATION=